MSSKDSSDLLKKYKIPSLDVDWVIGAKNLNVNNANAIGLSPSATGGNIRSRSASVGSGDISSNIMSPETMDNSKRYARRNSVASPLTNSTVIKEGEKSNDEENAANVTLRRTKSLSAASASPGNVETDMRNRRRGSSISKASFATSSSPPSSHGGEKKMGFFRSLFGKKKSKNESPGEIHTPEHIERLSTRRASLSAPSVSSRRRNSEVLPTINLNSREDEDEDEEEDGGIPLTRSKTESIVQEHNRHRHNGDEGYFNDDINTANRNSSSRNNQVSSSEESRNVNDQDGGDPRLIEFLQYYKSRGCSVSAFQRNSDASSISKKPNEKIKRQAATFSTDGDKPELRESRITKTKYDARGRPLPAHPKRSRLPSALKLPSNAKSSSSSISDSGSDSDNSSPSIATPSSSHKFGAFLRRVTSYGATPSVSSNPKDEASSQASLQNTIESFDPRKTNVVPGLEDIKPLKYVSFATNTYFNDPPQQICSKHPRQGEVEVKSNGSVVIHRLSPEEKRKIMESSSSGVVVGGSGQLKLLVENESQQGSDVRKREEMAPCTLSENKDEPVTSKDSLKEADQKKNIGKAAAETAAAARELESKSQMKTPEEDVSVSHIASRVTIDKPMVSRRLVGENSQTSLASMVSEDTASDNEVFPPKKLRIPHDIVYTRCCHLREILPIPATMKQLKKGSTSPIPLLQLRNPRPSMIEIWSFSDFLSIAPVLCLSLDGVSLSVEMLRVILSAVMSKDNFEKLSLRNTPLDHDGWKLLCYFVSKSKSLVALDLTMVPTIKTNVQRPSKSSLKNNLKRMECDLNSRKDMNWNLLAASVASKGGLEEVILSGAQMPMDHFSNFIEVACLATARLGLAYNRLTKEQLDTLANWMVQSKVTGLDIGFNDLNGRLSGFIKAIEDKIHNKGKKNIFKYVSLNCTNLEVRPHDTSETNEVLKLISLLCYFENLKFLDISNNPKMFPNCMKTLINCLPVFVNLVRLHLDYENLSSTSVVMLAEVLPLCSRLNYLSILGTKFDLASCKSLADAVRKSTSLITLDIDYSCMPANIKEKVSLYTMRNVDSELKKVKEDSGKSTDEKDQLSNLQEELSALLTDDFKDKDLYDKLVERYIERVTVARSKIKKVVKDLFDTRVKGQLSTEGKETLIRLCFIEASFEKGLRLLKDRHKAKINSSYTDSYITTESDVPFPTIFETGSVEEQNQAIKSEKPDFGTPVSTAFSSSTFEQSGHSMLLPFSKADVEEFNPHADDTIELHEDNKESSDKITMQSREEGSIFKSRNAFMKKVMGNNQNDVSIDLESLGRAADSLKTDQIKDLLLKPDMSSVVNVIDELHSKGYHLHDIFKKDNSETHKRLVDLSPHASCTDVHALETSEDKKSIKKDEDNIVSSKDELASHKADNLEVDEAIDAAYDQVLDSIQKDIKHD